MDQLLMKRRGGDVKRFHTETMLREHLVSSHSFGVALCALHIWPAATVDLIKACLYHDLEEQEVGDMPATTKWRYPELADKLKDIEAEVTKEMGLAVHLSDYEKEILKAADMGDLILACLEEFALGNKPALVIAKRGITYLDEILIHGAPRNFLGELRRLVNAV
jgi:5'-deoxynucleotidase YfbR-like HD superfamily hydrolase